MRLFEACVLQNARPSTNAPRARCEWHHGMVEDEPYVAVRRFGRACGRHWVMVLIGLVLTGSVVFGVGRVPGVYYGEQTLILVLPQKSDSNPLSDYSDSLIATASVIQRQMQDGPLPPRLVSNDLRLVDTGLREGHAITLRNDGGQWNNWFDRAELRLEAVGPSEASVRREVSAMYARVNSMLEARQISVGAAPRARISVKPVTPLPLVSYQKGSLRQAQAVALFLCLGLLSALVNALGGRDARLAASPSKQRSGSPPFEVDRQVKAGVS